jgi:hypothetical protein
LIDVLRLRGEDAPHGARKADTAGQRPGVDPLHPELAVLLQKRLQILAGAPVAGRILIFPDNEPFQMDTGRFHIFRVDSGVADERAGHQDDLPLVGGIGQDLLVAGHPRIEDNLAQNLAFSGKGISPVNAPILQDQQGLFSSLPDHHIPAPFETSREDDLKKVNFATRCEGMKEKRSYQKDPLA